MCYDGGRRFFSRHFIVFIRMRDALDAPWRVGLSVSKKVGVAVARNRVKRVLREFFRLHQAMLPSAADVVVVPKRSLQVSRLDLTLATAELLPIFEQLARASDVAPENLTACEKG